MLIAAVKVNVEPNSCSDCKLCASHCASKLPILLLRYNLQLVRDLEDFTSTYTNFESRYCLVGAAPRIAGPLKNVFDSLISLFKAILESGLLEQGLGGTMRRTTRIIKIPCRKWLKVITSPLRPRAA